MLSSTALGGALWIAPYAICGPASRFLPISHKVLVSICHPDITYQAADVASPPRPLGVSASDGMHPATCMHQLRPRSRALPCTLLDLLRPLILKPCFPTPSSRTSYALGFKSLPPSLPFTSPMRLLSTNSTYTIGTTISNTTITDIPPHNQNTNITATTSTLTSTTTEFHHFLNDAPYMAQTSIPLPELSSPQEVVSTVAQCVEQGIHDHNLLKTLAEAAANHLPVLEPTQISQLAVDFARMGYFNVRFKTRLADEVMKRLDDYEPRDVANVAWAFGELQYYDCFLMPSILSYVQSNMSEFTAPDLAKVVWAYARVGYRDDALVDIMQQMVAKLGEDFCPRTLAEVVFTEAQMGWADADLHSIIADHTVANINEFDGESLGKMIYGLASSGCEDEQVFAAAAERAKNIMDDLSPKDLSRIMWALSENGFVHTELLAKLTDETLQSSLDKFGIDDLRTIITACNRLGCTGESVARAALQLQKMQNHDPQFSLPSPQV